MNNQFTHPKERIRFAILTFFFAQGLCMASWASRIPDFKDVFVANYAFYWGLILFMIPVGKFPCPATIIPIICLSPFPSSFFCLTHLAFSNRLTIT